MSLTQGLLLIIWLVFANLVWCSSRFLLFIPTPTAPKNMAWCVLELLAWYGITLAISWWVERETLGHISLQDWEFYVITLCLFVVFSFIGFVGRVLYP